MELVIYNVSGKETGNKAKLNDAVFAVEPNEHAIYLDVKQHLANLRQGTHKTKQRNEIAGSSKKLHKQKGTGGSRKGNIKNPLYHGGGRIFGPQVRDYSFKLNKKVKQVARRSALSTKAKNGAITVVENFNFDVAKTKNFLNFLTSFDAVDKKVLLVVADQNKNVYLSSRNLANTNVISASELNTYEVLDCEKLFLVSDSISIIENSLNN